MVSAVPMYWGSPSSVTHAENWAESATTDAPQIAAMRARSQGGAEKKSPITRQHAPEIAIAQEVTSVRPARSARRPAATHPTAPAPITRNEIASASAGARPCALRLARSITGIHVHIA